MELAIDIETFSGTPITHGVYKYAADPDFTLLLFAYSIDNGPVTLIDVASGEKIPQDILGALTSPMVHKWAFNAQFERVCISRHLRDHHGLDFDLSPKGWRCSAVWSSAMGLPANLKDAAKALDLDAQKLDTGKNLIKMFCEPTNKKQPWEQQTGLFAIESAQRRKPTNHPQEWEEFKKYNIQDVVVENQLRQHLTHLGALPDWVWHQYEVDQHINDRGVRVDTTLAEAAIHIDHVHKEECLDEARELTGLENPNSPIQALAWFRDNGVALTDLTKNSVEQELQHTTGTVKRVLELRQELSRSSVKKYQAMLNGVCPDGRAHGLLQFYGAGRTGRWAGRQIQVQNLPRNYLEDLDDARQTALMGDADLMGMLYGSIPDTLSQLIRTAFIPADGMRFIVADYSAIEARVLAWLAGEEHTLQAFQDGKDLYCATASRMFGVPVDKHGPNAELRQKGKVAVLACGYQGGAGALEAMGALRMGIPEAELKPLVESWRSANPNIVNFWYQVETAAKAAISTPGLPIPLPDNGLTLQVVEDQLLITLPSGRNLVYPQPQMVTNRFGKPSITCMGFDINRRYTRIETYGGKLVENITQAVARDLLAHALTVVADANLRTVMHVHDEIVVEAPTSTQVETVCRLMTSKPEWISKVPRDLPLDADGYECDYYKKD
ncbi:MAG: DNA polymerase [Corynebacterium sp.]|uniref:DNA polymerase n=1 Tax=Corynebacterium sp. TaxID=1720 RepID=UPI0026DDB263|nr:DNA polymerase [Corynebacterium sp.]MDO5099316.1 DNA polymerase [Corynebacterium sp.]